MAIDLSRFFGGVIAFIRGEDAVVECLNIVDEQVPADSNLVLDCLEAVKILISRRSFVEFCEYDLLVDDERV